MIINPPLLAVVAAAEPPVVGYLTATRASLTGTAEAATGKERQLLRASLSVTEAEKELEATAVNILAAAATSLATLIFSLLMLLLAAAVVAAAAANERSLTEPPPTPPPPPPPPPPLF